MEDLFGNPVHPESKGKNKVNPCIAAFGKGPDGSRCKTCVHLFGKSFAKTYYKCDLHGTRHDRLLYSRGKLCKEYDGKPKQYRIYDACE